MRCSPSGTVPVGATHTVVVDVVGRLLDTTRSALRHDPSFPHTVVGVAPTHIVVVDPVFSYGRCIYALMRVSTASLTAESHEDLVA